MLNLLLLFGSLAAGALAHRFFSVPSWLRSALNGWALGVALPALILYAVPTLPYEPRLLVAASAMWLVFAVAAGLALAAARWGKVSRATAGALGLTAGLGNTAFVGLPLIRSLGGDATVPYAIAVDQLGSFLVLPVLALPFAAMMSGKALTARELARRVFAFPPMLAFIAAVLLRGVTFPEAVLKPLHWLSLTLSPVALVAVGLQLELGAIGRWHRELAVGLTYKLLVAPLLVLALMASTGAGFGLIDRVTLAQGAMAPMVTGAVIASQRDLEPTLASIMVGVGVVLSLLTVPLWWALSGP